MYSKAFKSLLLLGLAQMVPEASARSCHSSRPWTGKAIYMLSNNEQNNVVALPIGSNGMLSAGTSTATGGAGSNIIASGTNETMAPDALSSQSSLTVAGNVRNPLSMETHWLSWDDSLTLLLCQYLFAVNAGSNTVTMFAIDKADPTKLTMVGHPVAVPGDFPNTDAASLRNKLVCVATTGATAGISCAPFSGQGIGKMDQLRPINLQQTAPPMGPADTVSQVFFSFDERTLFTTVKGNPAKNNTGFLGAFSVDGRWNGAATAAVGQNITMSSPNGTALLFGSSTIPGSDDLIVTDPTFGAAILSVDPQTGAATIQNRAIIEANASVEAVIDLSANGDPGMIDLAVAGNFVYALSPGNGTTEPAVTVVDAITKDLVQHFQVQGMGVTKNSQGMAVLL